MSSESSPAYAAFKLYCEMGGERSHAKVARKCKKHVELISRWSAHHNWKERSALWDNEQKLMEQEAAEKAELELARVKARRREKVQESAWEMYES